APGQIIGAALRQVTSLHKLSLNVEEGTSVSAAVEGARPPVHFRRKAQIEAALRNWSAARLQRIMGQLADALLESRRRADLAEPIAHRALMAIAVNARQKSA